MITKGEITEILISNGVLQYTIDSQNGVTIKQNAVLRNAIVRRAVHDNAGIFPFKITECKSLDLHRIGLKSMHNLPPTINGNLNVSGNQISRFTEVKKITGDLDASYNKFEILVDMPHVGDNISLSGNIINNLTGLQQIVDGDLDISNNRVRTLFSELKVTGTCNASHNFLVIDPKLPGAKMVIFENNPCNPSDDFDKGMW